MSGPIRRTIWLTMMSAPGHSRHFAGLPMTSGLPPEADIVKAGRHVSNVPMADIASAREHAGQAQASWPSFKLEQDRETRARYEPTLEPSTRGVVDITQDVRLKLQILQSMLDYIADADDTD